MTCPTCDCEVFTQNAKSDGKRSEQPNLCKDCRYGTNGHIKTAKPKPHDNA